MSKASTASINPELDAGYQQAVGHRGHCLHESGHAVLAALCGFRVFELKFPRVVFDTDSGGPSLELRSPLADHATAWVHAFEECRALSKPRRIAVVSLSGLYSQFRDCRGHQLVWRSMRTAGSCDVRLAREQYRKVLLQEGVPLAVVRRQIKAFTEQILRRDSIRHVVDAVAAAYDLRISCEKNLAGDEFYRTISGALHSPSL